MFGSKQIEKAMSGEATDKKANRKAKFAQLKEKGMGLLEGFINKEDETIDNSFVDGGDSGSSTGTTKGSWTSNKEQEELDKKAKTQKMMMIGAAAVILLLLFMRKKK